MSWLLILTVYTNYGVTVTTAHLGDQISCQRAGLAFVKQSQDAVDYFSFAKAKFSCTEVRQ
jgi:hypothetical protein